MEGLYESILDGLRESGEFYNARAQGSFENYLASLQSSVRELRKSYRTGCVVIDYSRATTQAAYLIAYYPHYVEMTLEILRLLSSDLRFTQEVKACFFGAGPCPEVAGLAQFLVERLPRARKLTANVYDIASNTWALTRKITSKYVIPRLWQGQVALNSSSLDLCAAKSFQKLRENLETSNLFVFQNCLNELNNTPSIQENINFLFDIVPLGSTVIIADLLYDQNLDIVEEIREKIDKRNNFEVLSEGTLKVASSLPIPRIIRANLLTGEDGLIPRSKINFLFLAIRKDHQASNRFDNIPF